MNLTKTPGAGAPGITSRRLNSPRQLIATILTPTQFPAHIRWIYYNLYITGRKHCGGPVAVWRAFLCSCMPRNAKDPPKRVFRWSFARTASWLIRRPCARIFVQTSLPDRAQGSGRRTRFGLLQPRWQPLAISSSSQHQQTFAVFAA